MSVQHELTLEQVRHAVAHLGEERYELTLFVSGASDSSARAITNIRDICDAHLEGRHQLTIVDLNQEPGAGREHRVLATPTLVKDHPLPLRMLVGDMSDHVKILLALDVERAGICPAADTSVPDATA
jgi:circadian clock protein KaiB